MESTDQSHSSLAKELDARGLTTSSALGQLNTDVPMPATAKTELPRHQARQFCLSNYVEHIGLEPMTPCMPCKCATSCANAPYSVVLPVRNPVLATPILYTVGGSSGKSISTWGTSA